MQTNLLRLPLAALVLLAPMGAVLVAPPVLAQRPAVGTAVHSIAVDASGLGAGAVFRFEVRGTPNARAAEVEMVGQRIIVPLREVAAGVYQGDYTVKATELIQIQGQLAARLTHGDQMVTRTFAFPPHVQALANPSLPAADIERFVMRPAGRLAPGRELRFRMNAVPGGTAWVEIPGVVSRLAMEETRPGVYEADYTIRRRDDLNAFPRAVATLERGSRRVMARLDSRDDRRDTTPPTFAALAPAEGERISERGRTRISARIEDEGHGIDPASIRLRIDGRDVSRDLRYADNEVRYSEDLPPGRHTAELTVRDLAGNAASKSWSFEVAERVAVAPPAPPPLLLQVTSHSHMAAVQGNAFTLRGRTAPHATVRVQVDAVLGIGGHGIVQQLLDQTVAADAAGNFQVTVAPAALPLGNYEVRLTSTSGGQVAEQRLTLRRQG